MSKKRATPEENEKPKVHKELEGFDIRINTFGEINTSYDIDKINEFLNKTVDDKKLRHRKDIKGREPGEQNEEENDEPFTDADEDLDEEQDRT